MTPHVFVERMQQETTHAMPILIFFTTILVVYGVLAYLSERSYEKETEKRKYERNLSLRTTVRTKVELEINELQKGAYSNAK